MSDDSIGLTDGCQTLPQVRDINCQGIVINISFALPQALLNLRAAHNFAWVLHEKRENFEFIFTEIHRALACAQLTRPKIQLQSSASKHRLFHILQRSTTSEYGTNVGK